MTKLKKIAAVGLAAATMATAFAPSAEARWRGRHGGGGWNAGAGIAAGIIGGALLGTVLSRPAYGYGGGYAAPAYSGYYGAPAYSGGYYAPAYAAPAVQCQRQFSGYYTRSGRPIYNKVCYQY